MKTAYASEAASVPAARCPLSGGTRFVPNWEERADSFESFSIAPGLLRGVYDCGFVKPTYFQKSVIPALIKRRDAIVLSDSGIGRTLALVLAMLHIVNPTAPRIQGVVLCPDEKTARKITKLFTELEGYTGTRLQLSSGPAPSVARTGHIVVDTPERVLGLLREPGSIIDLSIVVMYEAEKMLASSQGKAAIQELFALRCFAAGPQVALFVGTGFTEILELCEDLVLDPARIAAKYMGKELTLEGVVQYYVDVPVKCKAVTMFDIFHCVDRQQIAVFCGSIGEATDLYSEFRRHDVTPLLIHDKRTLEARLDQLQEFRESDGGILITTGLLTGCFGVPRHTLVINYDLATTSREQYLQRDGRSGCYGSKETMISFVSSTEDMEWMKELQQYYNTWITQLPVDLSGI